MKREPIPHRIRFTITGTIEVDALDPDDALERIEDWSNQTLLDNARTLSTNFEYPEAA
jgi:hypothetical protein